MAQNAKITIHPEFEIGEISDQLFSAFLEPIGTMVNGTMYNPKHPTADEQGFRTDWIEALKATGLPAVRLPGYLITFPASENVRKTVKFSSERLIRG